MYESIFQMNERPFLAAPRADRYFPAGATEEARQTLVRSIERSEGPCLVIGPAGVGKSMLCEVLGEQFRQQAEVAHLSSARLCTRRALLQAILYSLNLPYREMEEGELRLSLIDHLDPADGDSPGMLLLVDEAHLLPLRLLEELRMITNLIRDGQPRVRLVLAGSGKLEERFASPKLESFNQRIAARCYLQSLEPHETEQYVRAQLAAVGAPEGIFDDEALRAVHRATSGIPRLINQVCDHALVLAAAGGKSQIEAYGVEEAWADLQQLPLPPASEDYAAESTAIEFGSLDDDALHGEFAQDEATPESIAIPVADVQADAQFDAIESNLAQLEEDFTPAGTIGPEVELIFHEAHDPFSEPFEEEEVVIDQYASLDADVLRQRTKVTNRGRDQLADLAAPVQRPQVALARAVAADDRPPVVGYGADDPVLPDEPSEAAEASAGDRPVIIIEDEPVGRPPAAAKHLEYGQLFAKLRDG
jgi:type II secretory pathway predicted ATPase ExeA